MSIDLFLAILFAGSLAASLITEAAKKAYPETSANILALINAIVVGIAGTVFIYVILDMPFNAKNVLCIPMMALCIWIGSMVGYDKCLQTVTQIRERWKL